MSADFIRCRTTKLSKFSRLASMLLEPTIGICLIMAGLIMFVDVVGSDDLSAAQQGMYIFFAFLALLMAVFMFIFSFKSFTMENRQVQINHSGISVKDCKEVWYSWEQIYGISIVAFAANASRQFYQPVICIFLKPQKKKFLWKILNSYIYGVVNTKDFVILDYNPSIFEKLSECCPHSFHDLRGEQLRL